MLVLIDTNVILDMLEKREPFYESSNDVLSLCASKKDVLRCTPFQIYFIFSGKIIPLKTAGIYFSEF